MSTSRRAAPVAPPGDPDGRRHAGDLRACLLSWFEREKRALPWRESRDPYRVWISEAMLQQTRVEVVVPYYRRFLERFPTVTALAAASVDDVLAHWSGLGYYRRARTLHATAREVVELHGGVFPSDRAALIALPGIGPYTAGALASIAFEKPEPLVDGNVARVFARLHALETSQESKAFRSETWRLADQLVKESGRPGDWNQALMELGATVCTARNPDCARCPVRASCRAFATGRVALLPRPKVRRESIDVELLVLVVRAHGRVLFEKRAAGGRMAGMWQLPTIEIGGAERLAPAHFAAGARLVELAPLGVLRHAITHHRIRVRVALGQAQSEPLMGPSDRLEAESRAATAPFSWLDPDDLAERARTGLTKKIAARGWLVADRER